MPRFDGTGPRGGGPMTGRGEGHCVVQLPGPDRPARGYAGLEGAPVRLEAPAVTMWRGSAFGRGCNRAARRGQGRRLPRR
jgi:hypothetical protein